MNGVNYREPVAALKDGFLILRQLMTSIRVGRNVCAELFNGRKSSFCIYVLPKRENSLKLVLMTSHTAEGGLDHDSAEGLHQPISLFALNFSTF